MDLVLWEWLSLVIRWLHVITGIAWIGSSFYFVHLDASLRQRDGLPAGVGGETWQVHGGGFYQMRKYLVAPAELPEQLTWFKWEAYTTWISGFFLLVVVYFAGSELYLIDREVLALPPWAAISIGLGALGFGWLAYDLLCRSPLGARDDTLAALVFCLLVACGWGLTQVFSGRGAFILTGSLIGTVMVANVFFVIIPNQKKVVADLISGREPDPALGAQAKQRSLHNNYLTLPVLFLMISGHYPLAFATRWNWLIVAIVIAVGAVIRHFFNTRHAGGKSPWWTWAAAAAGMLAIVWLSTAGPHSDESAAAAPAVSFAAVEEVILSRCSMCHAEETVWEGVPRAPKHVMLDTPERIRLQAAAIVAQAAWSRAMPPGNVTEITREERALLAAWLAAGAPGQ